MQLSWLGQRLVLLIHLGSSCTHASSTKRSNSVKHETKSWFSRWEAEHYLKTGRWGTVWKRGIHMKEEIHNTCSLNHKLCCFLKLKYKVWKRKYANFPTNTTGRQKFYINQWNKPPRKAVLFQESPPLWDVCTAIRIFVTTKKHPSSEYAQKRHDHSSTEITDSACGMNPSPGPPTPLQSWAATRENLVERIEQHVFCPKLKHIVKRSKTRQS